MACHGDITARDWHGCLLLQPGQPLAARPQREHQRSAPSILSKGTDLSRHGADLLDAVAAELNERPRKVLSWETPGNTCNVSVVPPNYPACCDDRWSPPEQSRQKWGQIKMSTLRLGRRWSAE